MFWILQNYPALKDENKFAVLGNVGEAAVEGDAAAAAAVVVDKGPQGAQPAAVAPPPPRGRPSTRFYKRVKTGYNPAHAG